MPDQRRFAWGTRRAGGWEAIADGARCAGSRRLESSNAPMSWLELGRLGDGR